MNMSLTLRGAKSTYILPYIDTMRQAGHMKPAATIFEQSIQSMVEPFIVDLSGSSLRHK